MKKSDPARAAYASIPFAILAVVAASWSYALGASLRRHGPYVWVLLLAAFAVGLAAGALLALRNARRRRLGRGISKLRPAVGALLGVAGAASLSYLPAVGQMMFLAVGAGMAGSLVVLAFSRLYLTKER